ncbi:hypothetical protein PV325_010179 [Microctonus aethiopoides]|nr:hypothetical protein PV325_010179 [Microctonus aethiopoides]KAK0073350.1 hypothetical protein PV326_013521 [Microctonus aethiopoides]
MLPSNSELRKHFLRTCYITHLWAHAYAKIPATFSPDDYGWEEKENKYCFKWFEGPQLPLQVSDVTLQDTEDNIEENAESPLDGSQTLSSSDEEDSEQYENDSSDSEQLS